MSQMFKNSVFLLAAVFLASGCAKKKSTKATAKTQQQNIGSPAEPPTPEFDMQIPETTPANSETPPVSTPQVQPAKGIDAPVVPAGGTGAAPVAPVVTIPNTVPAATTPTSVTANATTSNTAASAPNLVTATSNKPAPALTIQQQLQETPKTEVVSDVKPVENKVKSLLTIEVRTEGLKLYGSRDFRQPLANFVNYTVNRSEGKITTELVDSSKENKGVKKVVSKSIHKDVSYSFGTDADANGKYPLVVNDGIDTLTLQYTYSQGSAEAFKKGESVQVVLTHESWVKLSEYDMKKVLSQEFSTLKDLQYTFTRTPLQPKHGWSFNIGKGYFQLLGTHALGSWVPDVALKATRVEQP